MFARVNGSYRKTLAFARVAGAYRSVKNVYVRVGTAWRPAWSYTWEAGNWGGCSATCGGGTQRRTVQCKRNDGVIVEDRFCEDAKPSVSQPCNTHPCYSYTWEADDWGACSKTCGSGTRYRDVWCRRNDGASVSTSLCTGSKPETSQYCNNGTCSWYEGEWTAWSTTCGSATRTRPVYCKDPDGNKTDDVNCRPSGSKPIEKDTAKICTECKFNKDAYLRNKVKQQGDRPGPDGYKPVGGWTTWTMEAYMASKGYTPYKHYVAAGKGESVCGYSVCDCCTGFAYKCN